LKRVGERCSVLHGKKLPIAILEGIYLVLKDTELIEDLNSKEVFTWNDFEISDFNFLTDYLKSSYDTILNETDSSLAIIYNSAKKEFSKIEFDSDNIDFNQNYINPPVSGQTFTIGSGNMPLVEIVNKDRKKKYYKKE